MRLKGWILACAGRQAEGEGCLRKALALAHVQGALSWALRSATTLADLLRDTQRHAEAQAGSAPVHAQFTDGFDTCDLPAA